MFRQSWKSGVLQIFPHHLIWLRTINNGEDDVTTMDAATSNVRSKNFDISMLQVKIWNRKVVDNISTIVSCLTWWNSDICPFLPKIRLSSNVKCKNLSSFPVWKGFSEAPFSSRISVDGRRNRRRSKEDRMLNFHVLQDENKPSCKNRCLTFMNLSLLRNKLR